MTVKSEHRPEDTAAAPAATSLTEAVMSRQCGDTHTGATNFDCFQNGGNI